jgi:hypothetical protein
MKIAETGDLLRFLYAKPNSPQKEKAATAGSGRESRIRPLLISHFWMRFATVDPSPPHPLHQDDRLHTALS